MRFLLLIAIVAYGSVVSAKTLTLEQVQNMNEGKQIKLLFDYTVNLPILMRAAFNNAKNPDLDLTKEQIEAIKKHKFDVMDTIEPIMKEAHELSKKLKDGLFNGTLSVEEASKLASKIAELKENVLQMKIVCITFIRKTLSKEQFETLLKLDAQMPYLNSPYSY